MESYGVPASDQNPASNAAITRADITVGLKFKCYIPGHGENPIVEGEFAGIPEYTQCWVVDVRLRSGDVMTYELYELGVTRSRYIENGWAACISIKLED